jgi:hypothetical protein
MPVFIELNEGRHLVPRGEYIVIFDNKIQGKFETLDQAQQFMSTLGKRGAWIKVPNLRKNMSEKEIAVAETVLKSLVKENLNT